MPIRIHLVRAAVLLLLHAAPALAQGIMVDEGRFQIRLNGQDAGSEEFSIRRAGIGRDDALFATALVTLGSARARTEVSPLLRATPPDGILAGYQVKVTGPDALDLQMTLAGRRYVAVVRSERGEEDREFVARETTRVLDREVAHQYYFLRGACEGENVHVIVPRSRSQTTLVAGPIRAETLRLGDRMVEAERVEFAAQGEARPRVVWYDRLGRVLRVEVPELSYVAERTDLVG